MRPASGTTLLRATLLAGLLPLAAGCLHWTVPGTSRSAGEPVGREFAADGVTKLAVECGFLVRVTIGEPERATLVTDERLADVVEVRVKDEHLRMGLRAGALPGHAMRSAHLVVRRLDQITVADGSRVSLDSELIGENLLLTVLGMSEISGRISVSSIRAGVSGASRIALSGTAEKLGVAASGASDVVLDELVANDLDVTLSGATTARVNVRGTLAVELRGASVLCYRGEPRITRLQTTGASCVREMD